MKLGFSNLHKSFLKWLRRKLLTNARKLCQISPVFGVVLVSSCVSIPEHEISQLVVEDGQATGAWAVKTSKPDAAYWRPIETMDKYVCRSPEDERKIVEWAKRNCQGPKN